MPRPVRWFFAVCIILLIFGVPIGYAAYWHAHLRNYRAVRPGVLYRSGQMSLEGLQRVVLDYGIRTVVTLRDAHVPGQPPPDQAEEEYCQKRGINYVRLAPRNWSAPDGTVPALANVQQFLRVMDDPANHPVLVHCFRGVHRTGAYSAIFRMEYERWSKEAALAEMRALGYTSLEDEEDIFSYLMSYRPRWQHSE